MDLGNFALSGADGDVVKSFDQSGTGNEQSDKFGKVDRGFFASVSSAGLPLDLDAVDRLRNDGPAAVRAGAGGGVNKDWVPIFIFRHVVRASGDGGYGDCLRHNELRVGFGQGDLDAVDEAVLRGKREFGQGVGRLFHRNLVVELNGLQAVSQGN